MGKGLPQWVMKIWKFSVSDYKWYITNFCQVISLCLGVTFITLFLYGHSVHTGGQLTPTGGLKSNIFLCLIPSINSSYLSYPQWKNYVKTRYIQRNQWYSKHTFSYRGVYGDFEPYSSMASSETWKGFVSRRKNDFVVWFFMFVFIFDVLKHSSFSFFVSVFL